MSDNKIEELRSKVASLKGTGKILKVSDLSGKCFILDVSATTETTGTYGKQMLIVGNVVEGELELDAGDEVRLYLNNRRQETFEQAYKGEGHYAFLFGASVKLKNGYDYTPLELVESTA